jgi:hypothetical protein
MSRSLMLKWLMMRMRSDFGLPIGTEHAHYLPEKRMVFCYIHTVSYVTIITIK